jgi:sugar/nucleoside kinase (ribokinase family)
VAAAFVRAGGRASLITSLGSDPLARLLVVALERDGVRVHAVRHAGPSGRLAALIDERGERSFVTERGTADSIGPEDLRPTWLRGVDVLHVPAYSLLAEPIGAAAIRAAELVHGRGVIVSVDLSSRGPLVAFGIGQARARISDLAPDVLFSTRDEAAAFLGAGARRALVGLLEIVPVAVVKDGAQGCRVLWRDVEGRQTRQDVAAEPLGPVDATGAGDAFAAGFLYVLLRSGRRPDDLDAAVLRRAALAGHRAAAAALRRGRPEIPLA